MRFQWKRTLAMTLAVLITGQALIPAASAASVPTAYDETFYATLDYYGGVQDSSVVKSYRLNGARSVTDYGSYEEVVNLTSDLTPTVSGDTVTFSLGEEAPDTFYFEGKTQAPFEALPWKIAVSYKLNGAPALAEELAGKTGLIEIGLDVTKNPAASQYSRDNLVLTAAAAFNEDDITSLSAPGAQIQMVGNLRAVLFMVLPGEEQHFSIQVGSDDFSFSGLILLAVPATLGQLEKVADLREAKEKGEDSLDAIGASMDAILDSLEGMDDSLNAAAAGLDQLNQARGAVSGGKDTVYDAADLALSDLPALAGKLGSLDGYAATASQAVTDVSGSLDELNGAVQALRPELANTREVIAALQEDTAALKALLEDVESYYDRSSEIAESIAKRLEDMEEDTDALEMSLWQLRGALKNTTGVSLLKESDLLGVLSAEDREQLKRVLELREQYEKAISDPAASGVPADTGFRDFILLAAFRQGYEAKVEQLVEQQLALAYQQYQAVSGDTQTSLEAFAQSEMGQQVVAQVRAAAQADFQNQYAAFLNTPAGQAAQAQAQAAEEAYAKYAAESSVLGVANGKLKEVNALITNLTGPTGSVVEELAEICESAGGAGTVDDLAALARLCQELLDMMKKHEGEGASLLENVDELGDLADRLTRTGETLLDKVDALKGTLDTYEPELQGAIVDVQTLSGSLQSTLLDTAAALTAARDLLRGTGSQLDTGTRNTLSGVSDVLRKATRGFGEIDTIRNAKDTVKTLMDDEWDSHTGELDGLLNMDALADPVSMTDPRNPTPGSIQYVMRTQEIKAEKESAEGEPPETAEETTFWDRVAALFKGLWEDFKKLLHIG